MESIYNYSPLEIVVFSLVFLRTIAFVVAMPVFGGQNVPIPLKVLLGLVLSVILFPLIENKDALGNWESLSIVTFAAKEIFVGLVFGFLARALFIAISMAGQLVSVSASVSSAQLYNPAIGESSTPYDQFFTGLAILFFFTINGHHFLIAGLLETYSLVSIAKLSLSLDALGGVIPLTSTMMKITLQLSAPVLLSILIVNIAMALIGRAVPQINILMTSWTITGLCSLGIVYVTLPAMMQEFGVLFSTMTDDLFRILKLF